MTTNKDGRTARRTPQQKARQAAWYRNKYATNPEFRAREIQRCSNGWQNPQRALNQSLRRIRARRPRLLAQIEALEGELRSMGIPVEAVR